MSFNYHPLQGLTIALTRPLKRSEELRASLEARGAEVHSLPTIDIRYLCPEMPEGFEERVTSNNLRSLALVSTEATRAFHRYLSTSYPNTQIPAWNHIFALGDKTLKALKDLNFKGINFHRAMPSNDVGLAEIIRTNLNKNEPMIAPRGSKARTRWSEELIYEGFNIDRPLVYETRDATRAKAACPSRLDWALFFSPSAAEAWTRLYPRIEVNACAVIGHTTAETCRQLGFNVEVVASTPAEEVLVGELEAYVSVTRT